MAESRYLLGGGGSLSTGRLQRIVSAISGGGQLRSHEQEAAHGDAHPTRIGWNTATDD
ncbi:MAG: hypothetical protein ACYCX3_09010 [Thermoleophilia bacterium]